MTQILCEYNVFIILSLPMLCNVDKFLSNNYINRDNVLNTVLISIIKVYILFTIQRISLKSLTFYFIHGTAKRHPPYRVVAFSAFANYLFRTKQLNCYYYKDTTLCFPKAPN